MKKLLSIIMIFILIAPSNILVYGQENYFRVIKENAYLYETPSKQNILFQLPYSYYVKVLQEKGDLYQIEIYGEENTPSFFGYTEKENLFQDDLEVISPYPVETVKTCISTIMYSDAECKEKQNYIFPEKTLNYYGEITVAEETVYLIGYGERIGYVKKNDLYPFTLPLHSNPLTFLKKEEVEETISTAIEEQQNNEESLLSLSIICCLIVAGIIGIYVAVRKKDKPKRTINYYDENDYE